MTIVTKLVIHFIILLVLFVVQAHQVRASCTICDMGCTSTNWCGQAQVCRSLDWGDGSVTYQVLDGSCISDPSCGSAYNNTRCTGTACIWCCRDGDIPSPICDGGGVVELHPPQNVAAACDGGGNSITVTWTRQNDNGNKYKIARHYHPDGFNVNPPPTIVEDYAFVNSISTMTYTDTSVPPPGDYNYLIAQCDGDNCGAWSDGTGGINCPPPVSDFELSCVYPRGPINLDWTYPTPNPASFFGIAKSSDQGSTWNYTYATPPASARSYTDSFSAIPGHRYDYNIRACHDASCNSRGPYTSQQHTSCTVRAKCETMSLTLAPSPGCWVEEGKNKCWRGQRISGVASGYNGSSPSNPPPFDVTTGWTVDNVVRKVGGTGPLYSTPAPNITYDIPTSGVELTDTLEVNTNVRWGSSNLCVRGSQWGVEPHVGAVCENNCTQQVEIACNPNETTTTTCAPTQTNPSICTQLQIDECGTSAEIPCTCPTPTPAPTDPAGTTTPTGSAPTATPTNPASATTTPTLPTNTPVPPTNTPIPPTPTNTPIPPTPTNTPIPPTPTPTPTTPPQQAMVYGYSYVDQNGDGTNAIVSPGGISQFSEPALCGVRLIRKNGTNTGLPPNYTDEFAYYCYSKENSGSDTYYKWQTSSTTTQSVYARQCMFNLATKTLSVKDPNHPNVNYRGWHVCNGTLNEDAVSSTGDFVGASITCDNSSLAGNITANKPIRIQPKYISYTCPGTYVMSNGSLTRDRSFPPSLSSYSAGISQSTPNSSNPFPGMYQLSRTGSGINLQETLLVDRSFTFSQVNSASIPNQATISFVTNSTSGPYNFRFLVDTSTPTNTPTPTGTINTPTPTGTRNTPTPTGTLTPTPTGTLTPTPTGTLLTPTPTLTQPAWWQQSGGLLYSQNNITSSIPQSPTTYLITALKTTNDLYTAGLPMCGGNNLTVTNNNFTVNPGSPDAAAPAPNLTAYTAPQNLCAQYNYQYFFGLFSTAGGWSEDESIQGSENTITTKEQLTHDTITIGDLKVKKITGNTIFSPDSTWKFDIDESTAEPEKYLFLLDADISSFTNLSNIDPLIEVAPGAFVMFVTSGDINIAPSVGHAPGIDVQTLQGVYLADGKISIESTHDPATERQFIGAGTFMGCTNLELSRTFNSTVNSSTPTELFISRPDLLRSVPKAISKPSLTWHEL